MEHPCRDFPTLLRNVRDKFRGLHKPSASLAQCQSHALSCSAAPAALRSASARRGARLPPKPEFTSGSRSPRTLLGNLRLPRANAIATPCFPALAAEPFGLLACRRAGQGRPGSLPASRLRRLALAPRSPAASLGLSPRSAPVSADMLYVIPAKAGIQKNNVTFVFSLLINPLYESSPSTFIIGERQS